MRYQCYSCKLHLKKDDFYWHNGKKNSYCYKCRSIKRKEHHVKNKDRAKEKHNKWRERSLAEGGDKALKWYFTRHMGAYKRRTKLDNLPKCNLDADYLVELFHRQNGKCFYTQNILIWNNYGKKKACWDSMSLDRKIPNKGYVKGNVVLCTYFVNTSKGKLTHKEFYKFCETILKIASVK